MRFLICVVLVLGLFTPQAMAASYYNNDTISVGGDAKPVITVLTDDAIRIDSKYYTILLRDGHCKTEDVYLWCLESIEYNPVEFYPHDHEVNLTVEKQCEDCVAFGQACEENIDCERYCVNDVCRPDNPYCGDDVCDFGENATCRADCPLPEPEEQDPAEEVSDAEQPEPQPETAIESTDTQEPTVNSSSIDSDQIDESETQTHETVNDESGQEVQEQQEQVFSEPEPLTRLPAPSSKDQPNMIAAVAVLILGALGLVMVFMRGKKNKDHWKPRKLKSDKEDASVPAMLEEDIPNQDEDED